MKEFVKNVLEKGELNGAKLPEFIHDYSVMCGLTTVTALQITEAVHKAQQGVYDMRRACKDYAAKSGMQVIEVLGPNNELITTKVTTNEV